MKSDRIKKLIRQVSTGDKEAAARLDSLISELVERFRAGDEETWEELGAYFQKVVVWDVAKRLDRNHRDFKELVQDIMSHVSKSVKTSFDPSKGTLGVYIRSIVRRRVGDYFEQKKRQRQNPTTSIDEEKERDSEKAGSKEKLDLPAQDDEPDRKVLRQELRERLWSTFRKLPILCQKLLIYSELEKKRAKEIAEILALKPNEVYWRKSRCLTKLQKLIKDDDYFDDPDWFFQVLFK